MLDFAQRTEEKRSKRGKPTGKALDYIASVKTELNLPKLKAKRRAAIEEDLDKISRSEFVKINGIVHYVIEEGPEDGEPVVLVHGWDCCTFWWHNVIANLNKKGFRTICYDFRGHGFSDDCPPGQEDYSIQTLVHDLEALRAYLKLEKFHLATFSLGAAISTVYAAQYPSRVASLVFFNYGLFGYNPLVIKVMPKALYFAFAMLNIIGPKHKKLVNYYARATLTKNPIDERDLDYGLLSLKSCSNLTRSLTLKNIMSKPVLEALPGWVKSIQAPTLLVPGSHDQVIGKKIPRKLAKLNPKITLFEMPHCGHLILAEFPEHVSTLMEMFMSSVPIKK